MTIERDSVSGDADAMVIAFERFSIREYASSMRSVDVGRCWPFDGDGKDDKQVRPLPPISLRKFRWWSHELDAARSSGESPAGAHPPAAAAAAGRGKKQKAPRKRSIVELFEAAPPVQAADVEGEEEIGVEMRKRKRREKKLVTLLMMRKNSKKKRRKKLKVEICAAAAEKERCYRPKMSSSIQISHKLQESVHKNRFGKMTGYPVNGQKKHRNMKEMANKHKHKLLRTLKLRKKSGIKEVPPIHSILKNPKGTIKKANAKANVQGSNSIEFCCEPAKHVTFSSKDDILGHKTTELPQSKSLCKTVSDVLAVSSISDNSSKDDELPTATDGSQVVHVSDIDAAVSDAGRTVESVSAKKQSSDTKSHVISPLSVDPSSCSSMDTERTSLAMTVDLNHAIQSNGDSNSLSPDNSTLLPSDTYSGDSKAVDPSDHNERLNSESEVHVGESYPRTADVRFLHAPKGKCVSRADAMDSLFENRNTTPQCCVSCSMMNWQANGRQPQLHVNTMLDSYHHVPEFPPTGHLPSKYFMSSICPSKGSRHISDLVSPYKDKYIGEDFIGLPLNSQGELIKLYPDTNFDLHELYEKQSAVLGSIQRFPVLNFGEHHNTMNNAKLVEGNFTGSASYGQSSWFKEQCYPVSKSVTSGLAFSGAPCFERLDVHNHEVVKDKNQFFQHDSVSGKVSCPRCREYNHSFNCIGNCLFHPAIQKTVRLMGKNVTIGRSDLECQGVDDGRTWNDKEIITEHHSSGSIFGTSFPNQLLQQEWFSHPASGKPSNPCQPSEASQSFYHMPTIEPRSSDMHFDHQPHWMSRNGTFSTTGNRGFRVDLFSHPLPPHGLLNRTSSMMVNCKPGNDLMGHQIAEVAPNLQNAYQQMNLSSTCCRYNHSIAYSTPSTFHPPFMPQNLGSLVQPSFTQSPCDLPHWLINAKQTKKNQQPSCLPFSDPVATHHCCSIPGTNCFPSLPPYSTPDIPFAAYNTSASKTCGSSIPDVNHPSFLSPFPESNSRSVLGNLWRNRNKNREGIKFKHFEGLDNAYRNKKRPAGKDNQLMKPSKKPHLKLQESNVPPGLEQMHTRVGCSTKPTDGIPSLMVSEKGEPRSASGTIHLKFDGGSRSGPIKLSAGARHILIPSQGTDKDDSRPVYSSLPFSIGNNSNKVVVSPKKAAKIYSF